MTTTLSTIPHFKRAAMRERLALPALETVLLSDEDIPDFLSLQRKVYDNLPAYKKSFLKIRTAEDLTAHWEARMPMIGVREVPENGGKGPLVAQALLAYPSNGDAVRNLGGYPIASAATTAVVQSLSVDPAYEGRGLVRRMLDVAKDLAAMSGHAQVMAKVARLNFGSGDAFTRNGFRIASAGRDPVLGHEVYFFRYGLYDAPAAPENMAKRLKLA